MTADRIVYQKSCASDVIQKHYLEVKNVTNRDI